MTDIDETIERDNVQHRAEDHDSNPSSRHGGQDQASAKADKADGDWGRKEKHRSKEQDGEEANSKKDEGEGEGEDKKKKSKLPILIGVVALALLIAAVCAYFFLTRNTESTDDAYTEGDAVGIAPHIPGYVIERLVDDNQFVRAGQLMLRIDPRDYITARDQARANLDLAIAQERSAELDLEIARVKYPSERQQSQAQLDQARANQLNSSREYQRQRTVNQRATTQTVVDQATAQFQANSATTRQVEAQMQVASLVQPNIEATVSTLKQRQAQVEQAKASLAQAELNLSYTEIRAPQDGKVTKRNVYVGTYAQAGQQVFYITSPLTWVVANFKETQLNRMRLGQSVTISVDAFPKMKVRGHIDTFQQGAGARFTTFPSENATGNFVKIVRRLPVKIIIDSGIDPQQGLPLGLSVIPTVALQ